MAFKKVYSQIPACSIGHTVNNTLSCLKCDMMHIGSSMKLYVDEKQPVPVRAEMVGSAALEAGEKVTCKVTFDLTGLKKEDITVMVGEGLKVESVEVADTVATVICVAEAGIYGPRSIQIGHKGVQKMFSVELVKPEAVDKPVITAVTVEPDTIEVGGKAVVKVAFDKAIAEDGELARLSSTNGITVEKQPELNPNNTKEATAIVTGASEVKDGLVTATLGESKAAAKLTVNAKA